MDDTVLEIVDIHKHLGVILSSNNKWTTHIDSIIKSASKQISYLRKLKYQFPKSTLNKLYCTVQLGYCDSDVTVCLLFWNMPIIQDRDVEYPYKQYISYLLAFRLKAIVSQWLHRRDTAVGIFVWKTRRPRFESWHLFFFFFFFSSSSSSCCLYMCGNVTKGLFFFCI